MVFAINFQSDLPIIGNIRPTDHPYNMAAMNFRTLLDSSLRLGAEPTYGMPGMPLAKWMWNTWMGCWDDFGDDRMLIWDKWMILVVCFDSDHMEMEVNRMI